MLAPQLWSAKDAWGSSEGPLWPAAFLKTHILSIYFAAGVGKVVTAAFMNKNWCGGPTMQYFLYVTMWARPGGDQKSREWYLNSLGFVVERPWLCALISFAGLLWEVIAPIFASCHVGPAKVRYSTVTYVSNMSPLMHFFVRLKQER